MKIAYAFCILESRIKVLVLFVTALISLQQRLAFPSSKILHRPDLPTWWSNPTPNEETTKKPERN